MDAEELVIDELSEILKKELANHGYALNIAENAFRLIGDTFNAAPRARPDHFIFGILYVMQELALVLNPGKFDDTIIQLALRVATISPEKYLQLKALELLLSLSKKPGIGALPAEKIDAFLDNDDWPEEIRDRLENQWHAIRARASQIERYRRKMRKGYSNTYPKINPGAKVIPFW